MENDIDQINILQFINCFSTVYFNHLADKKYIKHIFDKSKKHERANEVNFTTSHLVIEGDREPLSLENSKDNLLIFSDKDCQMRLNLSVLRIHSKGKRYKLSSSVVQVRKHASKLVDD